MVSEHQIRAAIYVEKGGVGKTTSASHLAVALHEEFDLDVLVIDLAGRQNDIATQFGLADAVQDIDAPISAVFGDNWDFIRDNIDDVVDRMTFTTAEGVDLIPSDDGLEGAENDLGNVPVEERFTRLKAFVDQDLQGYDAIMVDLPGKESNVAINGLVATQNIVVPVKPGEFERQQLERLPTLLDDLMAELDVSAEVVMVIPTMIQRQKNLHQDFLETIKADFPALAAPQVVTNAADVENSPARGETVFATEELYDTGERAREAYRENARDLYRRLTDQPTAHASE